MMARAPEYDEGPEAAQRFRTAMERIVSVSKDELVKRDAAGKKRRSQPKKRRMKRAS
jgi:hypothetical protein